MLYKETADLIYSIVKNDYLDLDTDIIVMGNVFAYPLYISRLIVSPYGDIYIYTPDGLSHQVEYSDREILEAIHRRLSVIAPRYLGELVTLENSAA